VVLLAPMAGITDKPFRLICQEQGADETVTEMVSAMGYLTAPKDSRAYQWLLDTAPEENRVWVQVFGNKPDLIARACTALEEMGRFCGIDINMGCPAQKVTGSGSGSALMRTPPLARDIMRAARQATGLPLSVKIRTGWDDASKNAADIARIAEAEGLNRITVHGRTRMQQFSGMSSAADIAAVKRAVRIPVIANGDVFSARDAARLLAETGADGVMIGRGALGNPFLFSQVQALLAGGEPQVPTPETVLSTALRHADDMAAWKGERSAVLEMRKHFSWYLKGMRGAAKLRAAINGMDSMAEVRQLLTDSFGSLTRETS
jgi:tRNA-dihydrouridine synthase B